MEIDPNFPFHKPEGLRGARQMHELIKEINIHWAEKLCGPTYKAQFWPSVTVFALDDGKRLFSRYAAREKKKLRKTVGNKIVKLISFVGFEKSSNYAEKFMDHQSWINLELIFSMW